MKILYPDSISGYPDIRILYPDIRILYPKLVCFGYHFLENFPNKEIETCGNRESEMCGNTMRGNVFVADKVLTHYPEIACLSLPGKID